MLTPQMIASANKITGMNVPVNAQPGQPPSRAQQVLALGKQASIQSQTTQNAPDTSTTAGKIQTGNDILSQNDPLKSYGSDVISNIVKGVQNASTDFNSNMSKSNSDATSGQPFKAVGDVGQAFLGAANGAANAALAPLSTAISKSPIITQGLAPLLKAGADQSGLTAWATAHPDAAATLGKIFNVGATVAGGAFGKAVAPAVGDITSTAAKGIGDATGNAISATTEGASNAANSVADTVTNTTSNIKNSLLGEPKNDLQSIHEMITPKPTASEAKIATTEGRLYKGQSPTFFRNGTEDRIAASDQELRSAQTIHNSIPDAAKMDEPTLYSALESKIGETAQKLQPQMKATPIKPETIQNITKDWANVKKTQMAEAPATEETNVLKRQSQFERFLQKSGNKTMNDLWNTAKKYDASIKANVKNATEMSSESLQLQKAEWLQNRSILRNAINDAKSGMGKTSQQAFSDMHDMYEGQNGILNKAKVETTGKPSKFSTIKKTIKDHPVGSAIVGGASAIAADKISKATTGLGF